MSTEKKFNTKHIHTIVMLLFMFGFRYLPPVGQITEVGMQVAGVFIGGIYGWVTMGLLVPSICGLVAIGLTDAISTADFFAKGFGSQTFVLVLGMMILSAFVMEMKLSDVIVQTLLNLKVAKGKPFVTIALFLVAVFAVACVSNSVISAVFFIPFYKTIAKNVSLPQYHRLNNVMITGIALAACLGDIAMPYQNSVIVITSAFTASTGIVFDLGRYTLVAFPFAITIILFYVAVCKFILRVDASALSSVDLSQNKQEVTNRQKLSIVFVLATLLVLVVPNFLPDAWKIAQIFSALGYGGSVLAALFIMSVIYIDGKPLLNIKEVGKGVSWDVVFLIAYFLPIASLLTSDATGIKATLAAVLSPILSGVPAVAVVIVLAVIAAALTNFMNNLVIATVLISTVGALTAFLGDISLSAVALVIMFCCNLAFVLPSACPTNAFCYSHTDLFQFKDQVKHAFSASIFLILYVVIIGFGVFSLIF